MMNSIRDENPYLLPASDLHSSQPLPHSLITTPWVSLTVSTALGIASWLLLVLMAQVGWFGSLGKPAGDLAYQVVQWVVVACIVVGAVLVIPSVIFGTSRCRLFAMVPVAILTPHIVNLVRWLARHVP